MERATLEDFLSSAHPYAESTKRTYESVISRVLDLVQDPSTVTAAQLVNAIKQMGWGNSRQCLALAAVKVFLQWSYGENHPALSARIKRITGKPQRALDKPTALHLLASFDRHTPIGARDLALCSLALDTGLRCSELCRVQLGYIDLKRCALDVIVKGGEWAPAIFSEQTAAHIAHWIQYRKHIATSRGYVFTNMRTGDKLTPEGLYKIVATWGSKIGIRLSVHDLRRSFAVLSTMNGAAERVLMAGGRWKSSSMVSRYTRTLQLESMRPYLPVARLLSNDL